MLYTNFMSTPPTPTLVPESTSARDLLGRPEFTQRILVASTSHYPHHTELALFDDENDPLHTLVSLDALSHGWLVYITDDPSVGAETEIGIVEMGHPELAGLMKLAREQGFDFLKLDPDGIPLPEELGFATFNW